MAFSLHVVKSINNNYNVQLHIVTNTVTVVTATAKKSEDLSVKHAAVQQQQRDTADRLQHKCDELTRVEKKNVALLADVTALQQHVAELETKVTKVNII